jgi:hypothetical protein
LKKEQPLAGAIAGKTRLYKAPDNAYLRQDYGNQI